MVNTDPYGQGWLFKLKPSDSSATRFTARCRGVSGPHWPVMVGHATLPPLSTKTILNLSSAPLLPPSHRPVARGEVAAMLASLGFDSLDYLIRATVPEGIRLPGPLDLPPEASETEALAEIQDDDGAEPRVKVIHWPWLLRDLHAAGDPAEHPRESRMVHRLYALSGGDRAGPARSAAQFPDDDLRPHRRSTWRTLRCSTRRRRPPRRWPCATARRSMAKDGRSSSTSGVPADARRHRTRMEAARARSGGWAVRGAFGLCRLGDLRGGRCSIRPATARFMITRVSSPRRRSTEHAPSLPPTCSRSCLLKPPGEFGADVCRRQRAAFRRAPRLRRAAPRLHGGEGRTEAPDARAGSSALASTATAQPALRLSSADARATHPPRQGHLQHLHRASAAGGHGRHVCRLSRTRRPARDRPARPSPCRRRCATRSTRRGHRNASDFSSTRSRVDVPGRRGSSHQTRPQAPAINLREIDADHVGLSFDETPRRAD